MDVVYTATNTGRTPVAAYTCYGGAHVHGGLFAIHRSHFDRRRWTITHKPTGLCLTARCRTRKQAVRLLDFLLDSGEMFGDDWSQDISCWPKHVKDYYSMVLGHFFTHGLGGK